ncbi:PREDICTED: epididymis-specific alpha-mannosidase-like isoform X2 [Amphimedon queenslandica]|uniref:Glycoside hydrolase family 38 central domain-containing protein n=1 Tax=Amphimedon queenslandica TaxID=400682 RepID=A0AAN0K3C2_AMPQE|nr:PREDICTED: epididymis-specific alpha-mannosidase-like isoform X2 [Amphimedon queenslandica]|eukprot:XP_019863647.1 PREDICTED: epididymis-specific alpha-mannosidase-like isoform X2 [Amphimedon queenslandica]
MAYFEKDIPRVYSTLFKMFLVIIPTFSLLIGFSSASTIHLIPHSHCDAGYRLSFDDYYKSQVHSILDSVIQALHEDKARKFVWEEVSFLSKWWMEDASTEQKDTLRELLSEKRLEFIGGGWVMHDEAVTNTYTINTQLSLGLDFLSKELNTRPKYEWHIDPFGHSLLMPELYSALQYKGIVINRIPNDIKQRMRETKSLEFYWTSPYSNASMFTHVLGEHYSTPTMLGLDTKERAESFVSTCKTRLSWSRTNHLLVPFGNDFAFFNASEHFSTMDKIVAYINSRSDDFGMTVQYSTLNDYFTAVLNSGASFPYVNGGDFFPYIACYPCLSERCNGVKGVLDSPCGYLIDDGYWSGFFTSKPSQKTLARKQNSVTFALQSLLAFSQTNDAHVLDSLLLCKETLSLLSHHDAITGTSFPNCYEDYDNRLMSAISSGLNSTAILKEIALCGKQVSLLSADIPNTLQKLNDDNVAVAVLYNPDGHNRSLYSEIDLPPSLCVQVSELSTSGELLSIPYQQVKDKVYIPGQFEPFGIKVMFVTKKTCSQEKQEGSNADRAMTLNNGVISLSFDAYNRLSEWSNSISKDDMEISVNFVEYFEKKAPSFVPHSVCDGTNVYTFVPDEGSKAVINDTTVLPIIQTASGPLMWEIQQNIPTDSCPIKIAYRLFKPINKNDLYNYFVEVQPTVGPLPDLRDMSISIAFNTNLNSKNSFTTYTSGFYPMSRVYEMDVPLQKNYYPLVGRAHLRDNGDNKAFVIATKRPMGVTANEGRMELLTHRRLQMLDDPRGDDTSIINDTMLLGLINSADVDSVSLHGMQQIQSPILVHVAVVENKEKWTTSCSTDSWSPFSQPMDDNIHIISVERLTASSTDSNHRIGMSKLD